MISQERSIQLPRSATVSDLSRQRFARAASPSREVSPLIAYVLRGLRHCWMPELGRWSHIYHLDGRSEPNQSLPESDVFYTLNVLLGFSRIGRLASSHAFNLPEIFRTNVALVPKLNSPKYAYGMALWAAAELGFDIPADTRTAITSVVENREHWKDFRAQDLGLILIGCVEQARRDGGRWASTAHDLFAFLNARYSCPSGLFYDAAVGPRRRFSSFATQTYLTLACYKFGEWSGNTRALALAKACTRTLIDLQGPQGEWPWFYYTPKGRVVDWYEVYSVHQEGMAPAFLECAEQHEVPDATQALVKGFRWIFGQNQLNRSMLFRRLGLICRSQVRKGEVGDKRKRAIRAIGNALSGRSDGLIDSSALELRLECRSYELGWILWSFGRRNDLAEIQFHADLV
jgi:hypothetical protein